MEVGKSLFSWEAAGTGCVLLPDGLWDSEALNLSVEPVELSNDLTFTERILELLLLIEVGKNLFSWEAAGTGWALLPDGFWDSEAVNLSAEPVEMSKDLAITERPMEPLLPLEVAKNLISSVAAGLARVLLPDGLRNMRADCCCLASGAKDESRLPSACRIPAM